MIADKWLNEHGHRTRGGKPWSFKLIFTILRNRVYLGEVFFGDRWFHAPHEPLVDVEVFNGVQALPDQRGEDWPCDHLTGEIASWLRSGRAWMKPDRRS